jgi:hypothetical protein
MVVNQFAGISCIVKEKVVLKVPLARTVMMLIVSKRNLRK